MKLRKFLLQQHQKTTMFRNTFTQGNVKTKTLVIQ